MRTLSVLLLLVWHGQRGVIRREESDINFSEEELQQFQEMVSTLYPDGKVTVEGLTKVFKKCFPFGDPSKLATFSRNWYGENKDSYADFMPFLQLVSVLARGTIEEKLHLVFKLFDQDSDWSITRDEQYDFYNSINDLFDNGVKRPEGNAVKKVLDHSDKNRDGKISFEEFKSDTEVSAVIMHILLTFYSGFIDNIAQSAKDYI